MEKRCNYDLIDELLRAKVPQNIIAKQAKCSESTVWYRARALGVTGKRPVAAGYPGAVVTIPPTASLAERAARATAHRLGMDFERFKREWLPGKTYDPDFGFIEQRVERWPMRAEER